MSTFDGLFSDSLVLICLVCGRHRRTVLSEHQHAGWERVVLFTMSLGRLEIPRWYGHPWNSPARRHTDENGIYRCAFENGGSKLACRHDIALERLFARHIRRPPGQVDEPPLHHDLLHPGS